VTVVWQRRGLHASRSKNYYFRHFNLCQTQQRAPLGGTNTCAHIVDSLTQQCGSHQAAALCMNHNVSWKRLVCERESEVFCASASHTKRLSLPGEGFFICLALGITGVTNLRNFYKNCVYALGCFIIRNDGDKVLARLFCAYKSYGIDNGKNKYKYLYAHRGDSVITRLNYFCISYVFLPSIQYSRNIYIFQFQFFPIKHITHRKTPKKHTVFFFTKAHNIQ
jgi:hypothetical protein